MSTTFQAQTLKTIHKSSESYRIHSTVQVEAETLVREEDEKPGPSTRLMNGYGDVTYTHCEGHQLASGNEFKPPPCWDHNATVNATMGCVSRASSLLTSNQTFLNFQHN